MRKNERRLEGLPLLDVMAEPTLTSSKAFYERLFILRA
jgi:hypothetical protein